jgi:hypothetical protein
MVVGFFVFLWHVQFVDQLQRMYKLFTEMDCVQLEINPFVETPNGDGARYFHIVESIFILFYLFYLTFFNTRFIWGNK